LRLLHHHARSLLLVLAFALGGGGCKERTEAADGWIQVCPAQQFCFRHPPDLILNPQQVIDSEAGRYQSERLQLSYDLGMYSTNFAELSNPDVADKIIDGLAGEVLIAGNVMALRIHSVRDRVRFAMHLEFSGKVDAALGQRIFDSVHFLPPRK